MWFLSPTLQRSTCFGDWELLTCVWAWRQDPLDSTWTVVATLLTLKMPNHYAWTLQQACGIMWFRCHWRYAWDAEIPMLELAHVTGCRVWHVDNWVSSMGWSWNGVEKWLWWATWWRWVDWGPRAPSDMWSLWHQRNNRQCQGRSNAILSGLQETISPQVH